MKATNGIVVSLQYTLTDSGGAVLESSVGDEPLSYLHGEGEIVPGLESVLEGQTVGFKTRVTLSATEAYGERDEDAVIEAPLDELPEGLEVGEQILGEDPEGEVVAFTVVSIDEKGARLDMNHPFAGKDLTFDVEILGLREATPEELEHGHSHEPHGCEDLEEGGDLGDDGGEDTLAN